MSPLVITLFIISPVLISIFLLAVPFGAPFLPTLAKRVDDAIELLELQPGQTFLELGCGDGRLLVAAAKKGIHGVGYELSPLLVIYAKLKTWRYRDKVTIVWGNYWNKEWPPADAVYGFILQPFMTKLHNKVIQYANGRRFVVVSFAFHIEEKQPTKEINGMLQYVYND